MLSTLAFAGALAASSAAHAASLHFSANAPESYDFVDIRSLPADFGRGEFSLSVWIKPDAQYPVGGVRRATLEQLTDWAEDDPQPYSSVSWWWAGNWLLDGFTRPDGVMSKNTREGSFGLQLYGGGRLRWTFADADLDVPGKVWAVQAWPATSTESLLDGRWHRATCVRRWIDGGGARLELWIDGRGIAHLDIPNRVDMRKYWDMLPHPRTPKELGGWSIGSEVMTAWNYYFSQYEDYKGLVDEMTLWGRALTPDELAHRWQEMPDRHAQKLLARFTFDETQGDVLADSIDSTYRLTWHRRQANASDPDNAPIATRAAHPR